MSSFKHQPTARVFRSFSVKDKVGGAYRKIGLDTRGIENYATTALPQNIAELVGGNLETIIIRLFFPF